MQENEIKNFTEFLEISLNRTITEYTLKPLTKPGDNFGAILQSVVVKIADEKNSSDEVSLLIQIIGKIRKKNLYMLKI